MGIGLGCPILFCVFSRLFVAMRMAERAGCPRSIVIRVCQDDFCAGYLAEDGAGVQNRANEVRHYFFSKAVPEAGSQTDSAGSLPLDAALSRGDWCGAGVPPAPRRAK